MHSLIVASHRECTAWHYYPASGHYQATKARCNVPMAMTLETVTGRVFERCMGKINNQGFGDCFSYKRLNVVISKYNFGTIGLY